MNLNQFEAAIERCDAGIKAAAEHAERDSPNWLEMAIAFVHRHARTHQVFMAEDVRAEADSWPALATNEQRAWGVALREARRRGFIVRKGFAPAASSNGSPKVRWRSLVYRASEPMGMATARALRRSP